MGAYKQQARGIAEQVKGRLKENAGRDARDPRLVDEGLTQQDVGRTRTGVARASEQLKGAGEEIKGSIQSGAGRLVGNDRMRVKGTIGKAKGKLRGKLND